MKPPCHTTTPAPPHPTPLSLHSHSHCTTPHSLPLRLPQPLSVRIHYLPQAGVLLAGSSRVLTEWEKAGRQHYGSKGVRRQTVTVVKLRARPSFPLNLDDRIRSTLDKCCREHCCSPVNDEHQRCFVKDSWLVA